MSLASRAPVLFIVAVLFMECCLTASLPRNYEQRLSDEVIMTPRKRPFCNAFTGCGRKRSQGAPGMPVQEIKQRQYIDEETLGSILDSENTIDELSRQILSEAKLWEAIQEASAEIARRKQKELAYNNQ